MSASAARPQLELIASATAAEPGPLDIAGLPAARAIRLAVLARLDDAGRGYEQILAGHPDGLHDLRVALRRVRTLLRAFAPLVEDTVKPKTVRALRQLARATGEARDAEVAAAWVSAMTDVAPRARAGVRDAAQRLLAERDAACEVLRTQLDRELPGLIARLNKQLAAGDHEVAVGVSGPGLSFRDAAGAVVDKQKARLARALTRVRTVHDADEAHRARIAAKRLRYVLEVLHDAAAPYAPIDRLIELQDALGAARDAHQLTRRFIRELGKLAERDARVRARRAIGVTRAGAERTPFARIKPGLIEIARRAHAEARRSFAEFKRAWGRERAAAILDTIP